MTDYDVAVVGGGLLGAAFGWGLARAGRRCVVFDEGDNAVRTARGNFGLVWVQSKGLTMPEYAAWSLRSSRLWTDFAAELKAATGIDPHYEKCGYNILAEESELEAAAASLERLRAAMGPEAYDFEVLDAKAIRAVTPLVAEDVAGAIHTGHDGHCNPLLLLRALQQDMLARGAAYRPNAPVAALEAKAGGGFALLDADGAVLAQAEKVVVAAGHGSRALVEPHGVDLPIHADQGQVLVTEKTAPIPPIATQLIRQTDNGAFLLGASSKDVGRDTRTDLSTMGAIARQCLRVFPFLASLRFQRAWGALRVMTPDGCPIYQQSEAHPGLFSFACHSGVTLAAVHALEATRWVIDGAIPPDYAVFHPRRFHV